LPPSPHPSLQGVKLSQRIFAGISGLELDEKLKRSLIGLLFKAFRHLGPMPVEDLGASTARLVAVATIGFGPNYHASLVSPFAPLANSSNKSLVLFLCEPPWKLDTQLIKELRGADVRKFFKPAARDRPSHAERMDLGAPRFGVNRLWPFGSLRRNSTGRGDRDHLIGLTNRELSFGYLLKAPQIFRFAID
jgi:hypothetical protein